MAHASLTARTQGAREFRLIYALAYLYFLPIALVARVLPRRYRPGFLGAGPGRSVFGDARATADAFVPFAFMH